jgi:putative glutamine amidotransferase
MIGHRWQYTLPRILTGVSITAISRCVTPQIGLTFRYEQRVLPYEWALQRVGLSAVRLAPSAPWSISGLVGLVVTGGTDINPALYGERPHPSTGVPDDQRDEMEIHLLDAALRAGIPVLCICRGMQILNVVHGGTLIQDLTTPINHVQKVSSSEKPGRHPMAHSIDVIPDTQLARIIGEGRHEVNSRHPQGIGTLGQGLIATARAADGTLEAIELPDKHFALGVQWHPEDQIDISGDAHRLFQAFASAVASRQSVPPVHSSRGGPT